jgi:putative flippase GtrA
VSAGATYLLGQAVAILLVTPFSFAANKLWAFAGSTRGFAPPPVPSRAPTRDR